MPETAPRPAETCGASTGAIRLGDAPPHHIGPCVLRKDHDGPVHQAQDGTQWVGDVGRAPEAAPRPDVPEGVVPPSTSLTPPTTPHPVPDVPHPYVHLAYGPWEPSGHQCGDVQPGGCGEPIYERRVTARWDVVGEERFIGWDLAGCPSCAPRPEVPDEWVDIAVRANATRNHADLCGCVAWPERCVSGYTPGQWEHGDEAETIAAVVPVIERRVREQVARETRDLACRWAANAQAAATLTERERRFAVANALTEHAERIARGEARTSNADPWRCPRCRSSRWVAASLTGPVEYGGRAIKQCVPCGRYSNDPVRAES